MMLLPALLVVVVMLAVSVRLFVQDCRDGATWE